MVSSQARGGATQAWWACTGSTNRGFVSLDPERQCEVDSDRPARRKSTATEFAFGARLAGAPVRPAGPGKGGSQKRQPSNEPPGGSHPPASEGGSRR